MVGVTGGVGSGVGVAEIMAGTSASTARVGRAGGAAQAARTENQAMQTKTECLIMMRQN
jgi:hypothetical protein